MPDSLSASTRRLLRRRYLGLAALAMLALVTARPLAFVGVQPAATTTDQVYWPATTNVTNILVGYINAETVRIEIASWYLSEHAISIAVANRHNAGVPVRVIGDRGAIFEADPHTKTEFYYLANEGVPIRLRSNPTWFPEIMHWKAAIFVGQNTVAFGSGNFAPTELAPVSSTNFCDESELFTTDPQIVNAFKTKFDVMWNDTTVEPQSIHAPGPPYLKDWNLACQQEPTGNCADYATRHPNPKPMVINTARLEPNYPSPPDLIWAQGSELNNRLIQEINAATSKVDMVIYRLEVADLTNAILQKHQAGVPVRLMIDPAQYTNILYPEYWLSHANLDRLWAAGVPIRSRTHAGVTHMKTLITNTYAVNGSSNFGPNWQRDHNYFISVATKPAIYQAFVDRFNAMWADSTNFGPMITTKPNAPDLTNPAPGAGGVATSSTLVWNRAAWAVSYDVYLGTTQANMTKVANVPAQMVLDPPTTYSWKPPVGVLQGATTYYWKVVSLTNATPVNPAMINSSSIQSFMTASSSEPPPTPLPSPWQSQDIGAVGTTGSSVTGGGAYYISGAGADIWGSNDAFQFAYQSVSGDSQIVARVTGVENTHGNAKAGVMFRGSVSDAAPHVILNVAPNGNIEFMARSSQGGPTAWISGANQATPVWVRLVRSGSTFTGSISSNGTNWTTVGTTNITLPASLLAGLAVTSHNTAQLNNSTYDQVTVTGGGGGGPTPPGAPSSPSPTSGATSVGTSPTLTWSASGADSYDVFFGTANPPPQVTTAQGAASYTPPALSASTTYFWKIVARNTVGTTPGPVWSFTTAAAGGGALPSPWQSQDIGAVGTAGSSSHSSGQFTVNGAGADIWGSADGFHFAYQSLGDGEIVARVAGIQNTNTHAKAGVMIRSALTAGSPHVILDVEPSGNVEFMSRSTTGGPTSWLAGATRVAPVWLKLVRSGTSVTGSYSIDGTSWTTVGTTSITLAATSSVGLVASSNNTAQLNTSTFTNVTVTPAGGPPPPPPPPPATPSSPSPANGATGIATNPTLTWSATGATTYDVRFGTTNPPPVAATGQSAASYSPAPLNTSTTYFWRIVASNSGGPTTGPVWSFTTAASPPPPASNVVIYGNDIPAAARHGSWSTASSAASPQGIKLVTTDNGVANASTPLANPTDYIDVTFNAEANTPYTIWLRLNALGNSKFNDAVWVQFSDAQVNGSGVYPMNSTTGLLVNLATDSTGASLNGWGWGNSAYWLAQPTTVSFASGGSHTLRIQIREDGVQLDQIVLSPGTYLNAPPGPPTNDNTIVPKP